MKRGTTPAERHRSERLMEAGVFLKLSSQQELKQLMESSHRQVFGCSITERKQQLAGRWQEEGLDFSTFDTSVLLQERREQLPLT